MRERGLWRDRHNDELAFLLECPIDANHTSYDPDIDGRCCAHSLLASQRDFLARKGRLEEEVQPHGYSVIFYLKINCELNFIEQFWCANFYARKDSGYLNKSVV